MIRAEKANFPVAFMCRQLGLSTSGYYAWERREVSQRQRDDAVLMEEIKASHRRSRGTYGSPRIYDDLQGTGRDRGPSPRRSYDARERHHGTPAKAVL